MEIPPRSASSPLSQRPRTASVRLAQTGKPGYDKSTRDKILQKIAAGPLPYIMDFLGIEGHPLNEDREVADTGGAGELIDGIKITDGKVGGKIPVDEFKTIRRSSIKNPDADSITLGKFEDGGASSYIAKAGKSSSYFDMGSDFNRVMEKYDLSYDEMFEYFNKPVLDNAISSNKIIRFSHDPRLYETGFIVDEWEYIKSTMRLTDADLVFEGGFWIVK